MGDKVRVQFALSKIPSSPAAKPAEIVDIKTKRSKTSV